jgi:hypothetical protein
MIDHNSGLQIVSIVQCRKMRVKCYLIVKCQTRLGGNIFWRVRFYHPFFLEPPKSSLKPFPPNTTKTIKPENEKK